MKELFIRNSLRLVKSCYPVYDEDKIDDIRYGLEATYLSLTKVVVLTLVSFCLGILKEFIFLLILFNFLRISGFGLHASKSWMCWISSSITFIGGTILCKYIVIPKYVLVILSTICILGFIFYAPADTIKRPLIYKKRRIMYKIRTVLTAIIYTIIILVINDSLFQNILVFAMLVELVLIHPLTYRIFNLSYGNYKNYILANDKV